MSQQAALGVLMKQIEACAAEFLWELSFARSELSKRTYRSSQVATDFKIQMPSYSINDVGDGEPQAFFVADRFAVLLGHLGPDPGAPHQVRLRHFHRRAAILQSWLPDQLKDDVYLFLAAPAEPAAVWVDIARIIERDELICRKLVWLVPMDEQEQQASARRFCDRTFLSRPWALAGARRDQDLDFWSGLPRKWMDVLTGGTGPGADMVEQLLATLDDTRKP